MHKIFLKLEKVAKVLSCLQSADSKIDIFPIFYKLMIKDYSEKNDNFKSIYKLLTNKDYIEDESDDESDKLFYNISGGFISNNKYHNKYLKYKKKYLTYKNNF